MKFDPLGHTSQSILLIAAKIRERSDLIVATRSSISETNSSAAIVEACLNASRWYGRTAISKSATICRGATT